MRQGTGQDCVEFISIAHLLLGMQLLTSTSFLQWDSLGENTIFICKWLSIGWGMGKCPLLPLALGPSGAAPCRSYACCLGLCESLWVCPVVFRRPVSLVLSNPLALASFLPPLGLLEPWGEGFEQGTDLECSRIMFWVVLLLHSFSRTVAFGFSLAPQAISFQVLGHSSSVVNMLHPMEWAFSQIGC